MASLFALIRRMVGPNDPVIHLWKTTPPGIGAQGCFWLGRSRQRGQGLEEAEHARALHGNRIGHQRLRVCERDLARKPTAREKVVAPNAWDVHGTGRNQLGPVPAELGPLANASRQLDLGS